MRDVCEQSVDPTLLGELLNGTLADSLSDTITSHVADCQHCRQQMEQLAADERWWSETRELVSDTSGFSPLPGSSSVMALCDDMDVYEGASPRLPHADPISLDFLDPPTHPEVLGQLDRYQIESVIGHGGMGVVLKGFDTELNRAVAIKVLSPHLATSGASRQRFAREARAAAAVVHDHVVAIYGIETKGALPYIVMAYIGGESLQELVQRQGPIDVIDIVRVAMQVAAGLSAAHEQGLVHRDIKPANIMLENGCSRVLITDFGLARAADDASITRTGLVAGTPHYMSPEQANGDSVDHRSDLFSLGSAIYFMATGYPPFRAEGTMAVLNAICHRPWRSVKEVNADVPTAIDIIVRRLLQKHPKDRFESATVLRRLLSEYLAHLQSPTRCSLPKELRDPQSARRNALLALCVAMVGIVLALRVGVFSEAGADMPTTTDTPQQQEVARGQGDPQKDAPPHVSPYPGYSTNSPVAGEALDNVVFAAETLEDQISLLSQQFKDVEAEWQDTLIYEADDRWGIRTQRLKHEFQALEREWQSASAE